MSEPIPWDPKDAKALSDFHRKYGRAEEERSSEEAETDD